MQARKIYREKVRFYIMPKWREALSTVVHQVKKVMNGITNNWISGTKPIRILEFTSKIGRNTADVCLEALREWTVCKRTFLSVHTLGIYSTAALLPVEKSVDQKKNYSKKNNKQNSSRGNSERDQYPREHYNDSVRSGITMKWCESESVEKGQKQTEQQQNP